MFSDQIYDLAIAQGINPTLANVIRLADFVELCENRGGLPLRRS